MKTIVDLENDLVKPYIDAKDLAEAQTRAILGAHNLAPYPYHVASYTTNGITFTVNSDGTITANGTATALAIFDVINGELYAPFSLDAGDYILTDGLATADYANAYTAITLTYSDNTTEYNYADTSIDKNNFTMPAPSTIKYFYLGCCVKSGATVSNLVFKPMIRLATDADDTYQPYAKTNKELTDDVSSLNEALSNEVTTRAELGAHNLLPLSLDDLKATNTNGSWSGNAYTRDGITYTVLTDDYGNVTGFNVNGTGTGAPMRLVSASRMARLRNVPVILSCNQTDGLQFMIYLYDGTSNASTTGDDREVTITSSAGFPQFYVPSQKTFNNFKVYPLIRLKGDTNREFEPYAMTNKELTDAVAEKSITMTVAEGSSAISSISWVDAKKIGKMVAGSARFSASLSSGVNSKVAVLSEKPIVQTQGLLTNISDSTITGYFIITDAGELYLSSNGAYTNKTMQINFAFITA